MSEIKNKQKVKEVKENKKENKEHKSNIKEIEKKLKEANEKIKELEDKSLREKAEMINLIFKNQQNEFFAGLFFDAFPEKYLDIWDEFM